MRCNLKVVFSWLFTLALLAGLASCGSDSGDFAVKRLQDDSFRRIKGRLYVDESESVNWTYVFRKPQREREIGILIQKQEVGWIDVLFRNDNVGVEKKALHGVISDLLEGDYRLALLDIKRDGKIIAELEFTVYSDREKYYE